MRVVERESPTSLNRTQDLRRKVNCVGRHIPRSHANERTIVRQLVRGRLLGSAAPADKSPTEAPPATRIWLAHRAAGAYLQRLINLGLDHNGTVGA